jgi:hypothetical protein
MKEVQRMERSLLVQKKECLSKEIKEGKFQISGVQVGAILCPLVAPLKNGEYLSMKGRNMGHLDLGMQMKGQYNQNSYDCPKQQTFRMVDAFSFHVSNHVIAGSKGGNGNLSQGRSSFRFPSRKIGGVKTRPLNFWGKSSFSPGEYGAGAPKDMKTIMTPRMHGGISQGSKGLNYNVLRPIMAFDCNNVNKIVKCPNGPNRTVGPNYEFHRSRIGRGPRST